MANRTPNAATGTEPQGLTQPTGHEPAKTGQEKVQEVQRKAAQTGEPQFFEGTITKIDKDGDEVMSDHLMPGEKLRSETTQAYSDVQHSERKEASNQQRRDEAREAAEEK